MARTVGARRLLLVVALALASYALLLLSGTMRAVRDRPPKEHFDQPYLESRRQQASELVPVEEPDRIEVGNSKTRERAVSPLDPTFITGTVTERSGRPLGSALCELRSSVPSGGFNPRAEGTAPLRVSM